MAQEQELQKIDFELVSPEQKLVSEPVKLAVMPGVEGDFGVGVGHESTVAALKPGIVSLYFGDEKNDPQKIFIADGFADVTASLCTVLAEDAVNISQLDGKELKQDIKNLEQDLNLAEEESDKQKILKKLELANIKLSALS